MYVTHFGLREDPFDTVSGLGCFYPSRVHQRVYLKLLESNCERESIALLTGKAGVGKTTLLHWMSSRAGSSRRFIHFDATNSSAEFLFLSRSSLTFDDVLGSVCRDLAVVVESEAREQRLAALRALLLLEREAGRAVALLVDEAQNLSAEILEDLLSLSVAQREAGGSLPISLAGTPELVERLWTGRVLQPEHGVALRCQLDPMNGEEVGAFIGHRLAHHGYRGPALFEPEAVEAIAHYSGGVPRVVNALCHAALVITCIEDQKVVPRQVVEEAAQRTCVDGYAAVVSAREQSGPVAGKVLEFPRSREPEPESPSPAGSVASPTTTHSKPARPQPVRRSALQGMLATLLIAGVIGALLGLIIDAALVDSLELFTEPSGNVPIASVTEVVETTPSGQATAPSRQIAASRSRVPAQPREVAVTIVGEQQVPSGALARAGDATVPNTEAAATPVAQAGSAGDVLQLVPVQLPPELFVEVPHARFDAMTSWPGGGGDASVEPPAGTVVGKGDGAALQLAHGPSADRDPGGAAPENVETTNDEADDESATRSMQIAPADPVLPEQRVAALLERARNLEREGRYVEPTADNALDLYREALSSSPGDERALQGIAVIKQLYLSRAESAERRSEWALAEEGYRTASRIDPRDDGVLINLARVSELKRSADETAARRQQNLLRTRRLARARLTELGFESSARSLLQAAHVGDLVATDLLLAAGVSPDVADPFFGTTPLIAAAMHGRNDIVLSLVQADARIDRRDSKGRTAMMWAVDKGHSETVSLLLALGADVNTRNDVEETLLMYAAWNGDIETSRILLNNGADARAASRSKWTALMNAAVGGHTEIAEMLLRRRADVNARNSEGRTALMAAASNGHTVIVRLLLSMAADVNLSKTDGWTALMYAAWNGHPTITALLVVAGAQVDTADRGGWTPLMYAAWNGHTATVRTLLDASADPQPRNQEGRTALVEAVEQGHREVVRMLQAASNSASAQPPGAAAPGGCVRSREQNCVSASGSL